MFFVAFFVDPNLKLAIVIINKSQKKKKIDFFSENFNKKGCLHKIGSFRGLLHSDWSSGEFFAF